MQRRSFLLAALAHGAGKLLATPPPAHRGFENIAERAGVRFRHPASGTTQKYLPESMGAGVAMFDYNNDLGSTSSS